MKRCVGIVLSIICFKYQDQWRVQFPMFCAGMRQSPINIQLSSCVATSARLTFLGWTEVPTKTTLKKTVDSVQIFNDYTGPRPTITGGPLGGDIFVFYQAHFHWGASKTKGSEHLLNDRQFAMEAHIIFLNQKYASVDTAFLNEDGVAVIGRFYEARHIAFPPSFARYLRRLVSTAEVVADRGVPLSDIAPGTNFKYASYKGSLTAPVCREVVTWIVGIEKNVWISNWTIDLFRNLVVEKSVVRAVQPINGRTLTCRLN